MPLWDWLVQLKASYAADPFIQSILTAFQSGVDGPKGFTLPNGLLLYKGRIYLGICDSLKIAILQQIHDDPLGGHSGYLKSYTGSKGTFIGLG